MFLVDTNVVSEMRKLRSNRIDANVEQWATTTPASDLYIATITIFELQLGLLAIARRDRRQATLLRTWINDVVLKEFGPRTLPMTTEIALRCAALNVPDRRPLHDSIIAATALVHGLTVVTRNVADFAGVDVPLLNPWQP